MKRIEERTPEEIEANKREYNRPDSDHRKIEPVEYPEGVNWTEVYRKIQQGNARAKRAEKGA